MNFFLRVPLFIIVFVIYNVVMVTAPSLVVPQTENVVSVPAPDVVIPANPPAPDATTTAPDAVVAVPEATPAKVASDNGHVTVTIKPLLHIKLLSGATWVPTVNDIILLVSVVILYFELFKSTRTSVGSIVEHVFSLFVFVAFLVEFLIYDKAGTSTFLIVTMLSMIDVIGGFTITISTARRDLATGAGHGS